MAYQSLYRKYRPQNFTDVMGQGHVTRTLQNALASGRVAHGYLFTGTRGTAKTTVARLLAKALNCESANRPVTEPCNQCEACRSITAGTCIDVIEMDAASHRGVADIEEVRKAVGYGPMQFRYKVFIIDEAHQLSSDAKDAFLKTLEEPPDNVVFILATTEPQAIPITIRSRCQQFDFKRGSLQEITARLRFVLDAEGVTYEPEAIVLVARGAEGSYRDSLSLLEQVLAFAPKHVGAADVDLVLGTLDAEMLGRVTEAVANRDAAGAFALAGQLLDAGKEARTLLRTLALHFRDLLLVSVGGPAAGAEFTPEEVQRLQAEARRFTPAQMMRAMDILNEAQGETRWNNQHRLLVELTFLKMMNLGEGPVAGAPAFATAPIVFSSATPAVAAPAPPPPAVATPPPAAAPVVEKKAPAPEKATEAAPVPAAAKPVVEKPEEPEEPVALPTGFFGDDAGASADDEDDYVPPMDEDAPPASLLADDEDDAPAATPVAPPIAAAGTAPGNGASPAPPSSLAFGDEGAEEEQGPVVFIPQTGPGLFDEPEGVRAPQAGGRAMPPPEPKPEPEAPLVSIGEVRAVWQRFLQEAARISKRTSILMETALPVDVEGKVVVLEMRSRPNYEMITGNPKGREFVEKLLGRCLQREGVRVRFELDPTVATPPNGAASPSQQPVKRYDPIAAIDQIDPVGPMMAPAPSGGAGGGDPFSGNDFGVAPASRAGTSPSPSAFSFSAGGAGGAPPAARQRDAQAERDAAPWPPAAGDERGAAAAAPEGDSGSSAASLAVQKALEDPLVQEVLSVFGGEIVE